ncbi:MAG: kynurenine 3-monooxygenase [Flavobacteriales bacterium]|jgi:kynurenine 3-monooxygenase
MEKSIIVGAGPVGSLFSLFLKKRGVDVDLYERRPDMRAVDISAGRSINMAVSHRGIKALAAVGLEKKVLDMAIPMPGRMIHDQQGDTNFQPYGKEGQFINSISRSGLNMLLMDEAEKEGVRIHFEHFCTDVNLEKASVDFKSADGSKTESADQVYGIDGAFSLVRSHMTKTDRFDYSQSYLKHGYKELIIPAGPNGEFRMEKNALHIWPRGSYMLIALPNLDGSFTVSLFLPFEGERSFDALKTEQDVEAFFTEIFPDTLELMPTLVKDFFGNPTSSLTIIKCFPWSYSDKVLMMGDASHAIVPFYGQGMVSGFEDCHVFDQLADSNWDDKRALFQAFENSRKPDGDAIADLALRNFIEMRDLVADEQFILRKKIEKALNQKHPQKWVPLYSMVTFSEMRYSEALAEGKVQDAKMERVLALPNIAENWEDPTVFSEIEQITGLA